MTNRELLNIITSKSGATHVLRGIKKKFTRSLPILAYHRIIEYNENCFNNDIELISADPTSFERQIAYLVKYYQPIKFKDLIDNNYDYFAFQKPPIIITFDDGFYDNYQIAYPILRKYGASGTFFLVTNTIGNSEILWFDLIAYLIMSTSKQTIEINGNTIKLDSNKTSRRNCITKILLDLRLISNNKRLYIIEDIKRQIPHVDDYLMSTKYLSWSNARTMINNGMEIGSHSISHPILASMPDIEISLEIANSKKIIEEKLNISCNVFAYPVGGFEEFNSTALRCLKDANYTFACTYEPGLNTFPLINKFLLRRIHVERYSSFDTFRNLLISPVFGYK